MIKDVDKTDVLSAHCLQSPVLGQIPPATMSGGVKALIVMYKRPDLVVWATNCGDNCAKWIIDIAKQQDITIVLEHIMEFPYDFDAICIDSGKEIHSLQDYRRCVLDALR